MNVTGYLRALLRRTRDGEMNALYLPLLSWAITLGGFGVGQLLIGWLGWESRALKWLIGCQVVAAMLAPPAAFALLAHSYRYNAQNLRRIVRLFVALVLLCANMNFILMLHYGRGGEPPFHGIHPVWADAVEGQPFVFRWGSALLSVVDCLHFSLTTLSTVGYGDIYPTAWYSKLIVDAEILMGLGLTVLTVGRYFSRGGER